MGFFSYCRFLLCCLPHIICWPFSHLEYQQDLCWTVAIQSLWFYQYPFPNPGGITSWVTVKVLVQRKCKFERLPSGLWYIILSIQAPYVTGSIYFNCISYERFYCVGKLKITVHGKMSIWCLCVIFCLCIHVYLFLFSVFLFVIDFFLGGEGAWFLFLCFQ